MAKNPEWRRLPAACTLGETSLSRLPHHHYRSPPLPTAHRFRQQLPLHATNSHLLYVLPRNPRSQDIASFIYLGTTPESAYFEYGLFVSTGDALWRNRSFAQLAFWLQGQNTNASSRHFGAVDTVYELPSGPYDSTDRGNNVGYKVDLNAHMARYALLLCELVRAHEPGVDVSAWQAAGARAAQWVLRMGAAQAAGSGGEPGSAGFPQMIAQSSDAPTPSVVSGRTLNALPVFARLLGDSPAANFSALALASRAWHVANVEGALFYTAQHPDLPWDDQEQDSVWEVVEMWLDVADDNATSPALRADALDRAVGNAMLAFLMLCPKQLSWVQNPTQMAADEQAMYSQYSVAGTAGCPRYKRADRTPRKRISNDAVLILPHTYPHSTRTTTASGSRSTVWRARPPPAASLSASSRTGCCSSTPSRRSWTTGIRRTREAFTRPSRTLGMLAAAGPIARNPPPLPPFLLNLNCGPGRNRPRGRHRRQRCFIGALARGAHPAHPRATARPKPYNHSHRERLPERAGARPRAATAARGRHTDARVRALLALKTQFYSQTSCM